MKSPPEDYTPQPTQLDERSRFSLTAPQLWVMTFSIVTATALATAAWIQVRVELIALNTAVSAMTALPRWTPEDQREWTRRLAAENKTLAVPSSDVVRKDLRQ